MQRNATQGTLPVETPPFHLDGNPHDADNNIHALGLTALVLEAPHAVLVGVPVGARGRVHATSADLCRLGRGGRVGAGGPGVGEVLDDGAVDGEFVGGLGVCACVCGLGL